MSTQFGSKTYASRIQAVNKEELQRVPSYFVPLLPLLPLPVLISIPFFDRSARTHQFGVLKPHTQNNQKMEHVGL